MPTAVEPKTYQNGETVTELIDEVTKRGLTKVACECAQSYTSISGIRRELRPSSNGRSLKLQLDNGFKRKMLFPIWKILGDSDIMVYQPGGQVWRFNAP